jgi:hypothetical protein
VAHERVWLINQDVEQQLQQMTLGGRRLAGLLPPGGLSNQPVRDADGPSGHRDGGVQGALDRRRHHPHRPEAVPLRREDGRGVQQEVSIHLWFDQDIVAFKFTLRLGGQPWWNSAITA